MHIPLSLPLHFYLLYLLLNSCDGNDAKQRVFVSRPGGSEQSRFCSVLDLKRTSFSLACSKQCPFAFTLARNRFLHRPTALSMTICDMLAHVSMRRCFKSMVTAASVADRWHIQCAHVPASVHKFCSQPDCLEDTDLER